MFKSVDAGLVLPGWLPTLIQWLSPAALAAVQVFIADLIAGLPTTPPTDIPQFVAEIIADLKPAALQALLTFINTLGGGAAPEPAPAPSA